ncbi:unnamed protein product [Lepeophtheirus salmonis]|uniref:(salmon louse) hypothetical protein n=1 Tax=Lepeophtheirus salmonis TaxID=72036 RepID=A0A817FA89_LEPSM|nr:unnamed protein product [Lepeophtheirus salmonis]CAG9476174.1 unnamed protein product [Lepeophtheirus salmonis]
MKCWLVSYWTDNTILQYHIRGLLMCAPQQPHPQTPPFDLLPQHPLLECCCFRGQSYSSNSSTSSPDVLSTKIASDPQPLNLSTGTPPPYPATQQHDISTEA